jgi:hypothetical protein
LTIRASSRVKLTNPIAGKTGLGPKFFWSAAGSEEVLDMLNATTPAPAAAANPRVAGETDASSFRGAAIPKSEYLCYQSVLVLGFPEVDEDVYIRER